MNFYDLQQAAHTRTRWLNFAFVLLAIPSAVGFAVMIVLLFGFLFGLGPFEFLESLIDGTPVAGRALLPAGVASVVLIGMLLVWKQAQFDDASNYMAAELDCTYLSRETADAELRRVLNVTEEMAVAAESPHRLFSSGRPTRSMPSPSVATRPTLPSSSRVAPSPRFHGMRCRRWSLTASDRF